MNGGKEARSQAVVIHHVKRARPYTTGAQMEIWGTQGDAGLSRSSSIGRDFRVPDTYTCKLALGLKLMGYRHWQLPRTAVRLQSVLGLGVLQQISYSLLREHIQNK